jgi:flagellar hook-basal body complex protein FliE
MGNTIQGLPTNVPDFGTSSSIKTQAGGDSTEFMKTLEDAMTQVGQLQNDADTRVGQLLNGNGQDVHSALIAVEKASLAFDMMVQVRNKIVQAYQQVSGMQF